MQILRHFENIPASLTGATVVIGNFDGVHRGHQAVIGRATEIARSASTPLIAMTFEPHPRRYFLPDGDPFRLTPFRTKVSQIDALGVDAMLVVRFNRKFSQFSGEEFINRVLLVGLQAKSVVVGYDFTFGRDRGGDINMLAARAATDGFAFETVDPVASADDVIYSSTAIRNHLAAGKPGHAAALLGRPFEIAGRVAHGDKIGRTIGFRTANVLLADYLKPAFGIYAVRVGIEAENEITWYDAVANLGTRPTVGGTKPVLEPHIFDFNEDIYEQRIRVAFIEYIRPEVHYDTMEEMTRQIENDCEVARRILKTRAAGAA
jgi:riboflavin kinase/FMN adenylyltransferase